MKVSCKKCGKIFDYDTYMGICPGCASYHSISCSCNNDFDSHEKSSKYVVREYSDKKDDNRHKYYDERTERKTTGRATGKTTNRTAGRTASGTGPVNRNKMPGLVKGIIIFIVLVNFGLPVLGGIIGIVGSVFESVSDSLENEWDSHEDDWDSYEEEVTTDYEDSGMEETYRENELNYSYEDEDWSLHIVDTAVDSAFDGVLPEGYEMIEVTYVVQHEDTYDDFPPEMISENTIPYVMTSDGNCVTPQPREEVGKLLGYELEELEDSYITDKFNLPMGTMYFWVEEGQADNLLVNVISDGAIVETKSIDIY